MATYEKERFGTSMVTDPLDPAACPPPPLKGGGALGGKFVRAGDLIGTQQIATPDVAGGATDARREVTPAHRHALRRDLASPRRMLPVAPDVVCVQDLIVNFYLVGEPGTTDFVLVDTGMPGAAERVKRAIAARFGFAARPRAILLTHGHFDHVGSARTLANEWNVPVYAHELELPYLTGLSSYPPGDSGVGGGMMACMAWTFPRRPIRLGGRVQPLPEDGSVPHLPGWRWVFTPGHAPGHVSLFREVDRLLLAGDAVVTTDQESLFSVLTQRRVLQGPPKYFTCDWAAAWASVQRIADLQPNIIASGHGVPMHGADVIHGLANLVRDFDALAVPHHGRYVAQPAITDKTGLVTAPPPQFRSFVPALTVLGVVAGAVGLTFLARRGVFPFRRRPTLVQRLAALPRRTRDRVLYAAHERGVPGVQRIARAVRSYLRETGRRVRRAQASMCAARR